MSKINSKYNIFCQNIYNNSIIKYGTLDNNHKKKLEKINDKYNNLNKLNNEVDKLNNKINSVINILEISNIKERIKEIEYEIYYIKNYDEELDYYNDTIDILLNYYDDNNLNNRASLFNNYMKIVNNRTIKNDKKKISNICEKCGIEKNIKLIDKSLMCVNCGIVEEVIMESEKPNYKDNNIEWKVCLYKRGDHLSEILNQFQGKETTDIPNDIINNILKELKKIRFYDLKKLDRKILKKILKTLNYNKYYKHIPIIINKINGIQPPIISRDLEEKIKSRFKLIQEPFTKFKPEKRKNLISYNYILHKIFQLLDLDDFLKYFPLLKSQEKLYEQDLIWQKICNYLKWQFIPSI